jgi:hypothetical protein
MKNLITPNDNIVSDRKPIPTNGDMVLNLFKNIESAFTCNTVLDNVVMGMVLKDRRKMYTDIIAETARYGPTIEK